MSHAGVTRWIDVVLPRRVRTVPASDKPSAPTQWAILSDIVRFASVVANFSDRRRHYQSNRDKKQGRGCHTPKGSPCGEDTGLPR